MGRTNPDDVGNAPGGGIGNLPDTDLRTAIEVLEREATVSAERIRTLNEDRLALRHALEQQERLLLEARKQYRRKLIYVAAPYILLLAPLALPVLLVLYVTKRRRKTPSRTLAPFLQGKDRDEP